VAKQASGGCFLLIFGLIWSAMTLTFDTLIGYQCAKGIGSYQFEETTGTVTHSHVEQTRDNKRKLSFRPQVQYDYVVGGKTLHGKVRTFGEATISGTGAQRSAEGVLKRYPVGKEVTVYFDPKDPSQAVLERGIGGNELLLILFMTPFNGVMLGIWSAAFYQWRRRGEEPLKRLLHQTAYGWQIHERCGLLTALILGVSVVAFFAIFVVIFGIGFYPPLTTMLVVWSVVFVLGTVIAMLIVGFPQGISIDDMDGTVTLRGWFGAAKAQVPKNKVQGVQVKKGNKQEGTQQMYEAVLHYDDDDGVPQTCSIVMGQTHVRAVAVREWVHEKLEIREPSAMASVDAEAE
jgi:hypothetical protein